MFKLRCKRHYRSLATYSWCTTWREQLNRSRKRRRRDADIRSAAAARRRRTALIRVSSGRSLLYYPNYTYAVIFVASFSRTRNPQLTQRWTYLWLPRLQPAQRLWRWTIRGMMLTGDRAPRFPTILTRRRGTRSNGMRRQTSEMLAPHSAAAAARQIPRLRYSSKRLPDIFDAKSPPTCEK